MASGPNGQDVSGKPCKSIAPSPRFNLISTIALAGEIEWLLAVNRALDAKLLAVMMSTPARPRAESGLKVLEDHIVTLICDLFCRESKASALFGKAGVFACPGNHHLETGAVTDKNAIEQACYDVCLKTLPVGVQVFTCRACD
jgi:hypothetical protein